MIRVEIKDGKRRKTYYCRNELYNMGLRLDKQKNCWYMIINEDFEMNLYLSYRQYAKKKKFKFYSYPTSYERRHGYRKRFFENYKPIFHDKYFCAYCGKLLDKNEVTIDHIISTNLAQRKTYSQRLLQCLDIQDINEPRNLAPCCLPCNAKKSNKGGSWIVRGFIGKHSFFWIGLYILLMIWILVLVYWIVRLLL